MQIILRILSRRRQWLHHLQFLLNIRSARYRTRHPEDAHSAVDIKTANILYSRSEI